MGNHKFELPDGSYLVLDTEDYIEYITKINETLSSISIIHIYINSINNGLLLKIKTDIS